jgi:hypothetical protein
MPRAAEPRLRTSGAVPLRLALLGLALALAVTPRPAAADKGVALDSGRIEVTGRLSRGGTYELLPLAVRNPGSEVTTYEMGLDFIRDQAGQRPSAGWFHFEPRRFSLNPGLTTRVLITLELPPSARPGDYEALIVAAIVSDGSGTRLGGAAGARLSFNVKPSSFIEAWSLEARNWIEDNAPWTYAVPLVGLGAVLVWFASRRVSLRIETRR